MNEIKNPADIDLDTADTVRMSNPFRQDVRSPWKVRDVMTARIFAVEVDASLDVIARVMHRENVGFVPVVDDTGQIHGCITDRDLVIRALDEVGPDGVLRKRARDVMTPEVVTVSPEDDLDKALELMGAQQIRRLPVADSNGRLVGVLALSDIALHAQKDEALMRAIERVWQEPPSDEAPARDS